MDELLRADDSASTGLMGAMEQESVSVSERIATMGGDEKRKLRERLGAKRRSEQPSCSAKSTELSESTRKARSDWLMLLLEH